MRAYFFTNMYLSSIQNGIQSAHCLAEMFTKYDRNTVNSSTLLYDWANNHKTMIVLNGGFSDSIRDLYRFFTAKSNPYPTAQFHEGTDALDGALTCVGIVLPEKIYELASTIRCTSSQYGEREAILRSIQTTGQYDDQDISKWEFELIERLNTFSLAT